MSSSLPEQVKQILEVVGTALRRVSNSRSSSSERNKARAARATAQEEQEHALRERIARGTYHDPRLGPIAGNGVMSELGLGDEPFGPADEDAVEVAETTGEGEHPEKDTRRDAATAEAVNALPIVVIKNFASAAGKEEVIGVFVQWAAALADGQVAHVIVVSDNRENSKRLAKGAPPYTLHKALLIMGMHQHFRANLSIRLPCMTQMLRVHCNSSSSVSKMSTWMWTLLLSRQATLSASADVLATSPVCAASDPPGSRSNSCTVLQLIHKVQSGQHVEEAVEDIIARGVSELRKSAFGDDLDDAKSLPWTREQAWAVLKALSIHNEVPYHDMLVNFPFKGDEAALRSMEQAELVTIGTHNGVYLLSLQRAYRGPHVHVKGRPSVIRPGKPVYRFVFEQLVSGTSSVPTPRIPSLIAPRRRQTQYSKPRKTLHRTRSSSRPQRQPSRHASRS